MEKVGSEEPVHFLLMSLERVGAPPMRHPIAASILNSRVEAFTELDFVHISSEASWVPEIIHILLQRTFGMVPVLIQVIVIATHNSNAALK
jgi:hypothetical protein